MSTAGGAYPGAQTLSQVGGAFRHDKAGRASAGQTGKLVTVPGLPLRSDFVFGESAYGRVRPADGAGGQATGFGAHDPGPRHDARGDGRWRSGWLAPPG